MAIVIALWERHPAAIPIEAGRLSHGFVRRDAGLLPVGAVFQPRWSRRHAPSPSGRGAGCRKPSIGPSARVFRLKGGKSVKC